MVEGLISALTLVTDGGPLGTERMGKGGETTNNHSNPGSPLQKEVSGD